MQVALTVAGISLLLFVFFCFIFNKEKSLGKRFFLVRVRHFTDNLIEDFIFKCKKSFRYIVKYIITLSWYYSLHAFLKLILKFLAGIYYYIETILHRNRDKVKKIRNERKRESKSHLSVIADHKEGNQLSEKQKKALKEKSLAGR